MRHRQDASIHAEQSRVWQVGTLLRHCISAQLLVSLLKAEQQSRGAASSQSLPASPDVQKFVQMLELADLSSTQKRPACRKLFILFYERESCIAFQGCRVRARSLEERAEERASTVRRTGSASKQKSSAPSAR